ncbi:MAG: DUF2939 domain-containing protein, partial [Rhizobiales bacterium]|nr:DUF2939 domain-containing protein [Hyphomicrobiales bacterium]
SRPWRRPPSRLPIARRCAGRREPRTRLRPGLRSGLRRAARIAIVLLLVAVAWVAWLAIALEDFSGALEDGDPVALERRIDWVNVQQGLRDDLAAIASSQATSGLNDRAIAALTTRQAVANLLRTVKLDDRGWDMAAPATWPAPSFSWLGIRHAFFSGGPFAFRVDVRPESRTIKRPLILLFKWRGDWQLARVFLPEDSFGRTPRTPQASAQPQTAAQPQASTQPAPAAAPPPGAEQAVLYEETGSDSNGKHLTGSVTWRTEQTPSASGGPPELAVVAEARIPPQSRPDPAREPHHRHQVRPAAEHAQRRHPQRGRGPVERRRPKPRSKARRQRGQGEPGLLPGRAVRHRNGHAAQSATPQGPSLVRHPVRLRQQPPRHSVARKGHHRRKGHG